MANLGDKKLDLSAQQAAMLRVALRQAIEGMSRSIGKTHFNLVKEALEKQRDEYKALLKKLEE